LASVGRVLDPNNGLAWHVVNEDLMIFVVFIKVRKYKDLNMHSNGGFNETRGLITCVGKYTGVGGCASVEKNNVVMEVE
jgi:hypothetical protein